MNCINYIWNWLALDFQYLVYLKACNNMGFVPISYDMFMIKGLNKLYSHNSLKK